MVYHKFSQLYALIVAYEQFWKEFKFSSEEKPRVLGAYDADYARPVHHHPLQHISTRDETIRLEISASLICLCNSGGFNGFGSQSCIIPATNFT